MTLKNILRAGLVLFIISNHHSVQGQETAVNPEDESAISYFKSASLLKCFVKLPENYNPDETRTLVIGLHGGGGNPDSFLKSGIMRKM
jgi:hypothetical protein